MASFLRIRIGALGLAIVIGLAFLGALAPYLPIPDPNVANVLDSYLPPDAAHPFGTDALGRDVLARVIWGVRTSLSIGVGIVAIGMILGVTLGLYSGWLEGTLVEELAMRLVDIFAAIPVLIWAIAVVGVLGPGPTELGCVKISNEVKIVLLIGILFFPGVARITHSLTIAELKNEYIAAREARLQGASSTEILFGDVLPNIVSPLLVQASVLVGVGIIIEASLSFVGLGVQPPTPSWGGMLGDSKQTVFSGEYWLSVFPGLAIFLAVIAFNFVGDALRDYFDPRHRASRDMASFRG